MHDDLVYDTLTMTCVVLSFSSSKCDMCDAFVFTICSGTLTRAVFSFVEQWYVHSVFLLYTWVMPSALRFRLVLTTYNLKYMIRRITCMLWSDKNPCFYIEKPKN